MVSIEASGRTIATRVVWACIHILIDVGVGVGVGVGDLGDSVGIIQVILKQASMGTGVVVNGGTIWVGYHGSG